MPKPKPEEGQTREEFLEVCIPAVLEEGTAESQEQAYAICESYWEEKMSKFVQIKKTEPEHQVVKGIVYQANEVDSDGETMTADEVRKAAWDFLANRREKNIDIGHDWQESGCYVVESYVTEAADGVFPQDAWIMSVKCTEDIWQRVKNGDLNGFSFGGSAKVAPKRVLTEVAKEVVGDTETNLNKDVIPEHSHTFIVRLNKEGQIVSGHTGIAEDHYHTISYGTATDKNVGHSHRLTLGGDE
jgi:hypothetical protein